MEIMDLWREDPERARDKCTEITKRPGKFEGARIWTPYFWELVLDGGAESTFYVREIEHDVFKIDTHDRLVFPELGEATHVVVLEDDHGFVVAKAVTEAELATWEAEADTDDDTDDE